MRLLANGFTTAATTFAGTTAGTQEAFTGGSALGGKGFVIKKIVAFAGGTTAAAGSSGLIKFRYGATSDAVISTLIILASEHNDAITSAVGAGSQNIVLDGLNISASWFDFDATVLSAGVGVFVFGD